MVPAAQTGPPIARLCPDGAHTGAADDTVTHILHSAGATTARANATGPWAVSVDAAVPALGRCAMGPDRAATNRGCTAVANCASIYICTAALGRIQPPAEKPATVCTATTGRTLWCLAGLRDRRRWLGFSRGGSGVGWCHSVWWIADPDAAGRYVVEKLSRVRLGCRPAAVVNMFYSAGVETG